MSTLPRKPLWLLPNLLSLDAPLVAVAWLYLFARSWRLGYHPWQAYVTLGLAVWIIYVVDRLLDASLLNVTSDKLKARHAFHRKYQSVFLIGVGIALVSAVFLMVTRMPMAIYAYLLIGGVMVAGFFGLAILFTQGEQVAPHTKNILAGLTFSFGTAITAHVYRSGFGLDAMLYSWDFICFAALCVLNISAIDLWENAERTTDRKIKASDEWALSLPLTVLGGAAIVFALLDEQMAARPFFYAILTGAALLLVLNKTRTRLPMDALRVLADVALLIPPVVFIAFTSSE